MEAELFQDESGVIVSIDENILNAPAGQHVDDVLQDGFAPGGNEGFGAEEGQGQKALAVTSGKDDSFGGAFHGELTL
jgi:hypothetical protein